MDADFYRMLFDYNYWARDRLLAAAAGISDDEYARPNGFTHSSIRGILTHMLNAEVIWLARWRQEAPNRVTGDQLPGVEALRQRWLDEESRVRAFLATLSDEHIAQEIVSRASDGEEFRRPLWEDLLHVAIHSIQHRSEAAEALTMVGRSPGELDIKEYLAERAG